MMHFFDFNMKNSACTTFTHMLTLSSCNKTSNNFNIKDALGYILLINQFIFIIITIVLNNLNFK